MKKNILHRDISENNIMLIDAGDGQRAGCLIDFDHAVDLSDENALETVKQRTVKFVNNTRYLHLLTVSIRERPYLWPQTF